jgi:hypothetical protein
MSPATDGTADAPRHDLVLLRTDDPRAAGRQSDDVRLELVRPPAGTSRP